LKHTSFIRGSARRVGTLALICTGFLYAASASAMDGSIKELWTMGHETARAYVCGVLGSDMRGVASHYDDILRLHTALARHAGTVSVQNLTLAYIEGGQTVGPPSPKDCEKVKQKWRKFDLKQAKLDQKTTLKELAAARR
jgi:hypothetical protein